MNRMNRRPRARAPPRCARRTRRTRRRRSKWCPWTPSLPSISLSPGVAPCVWRAPRVDLIEQQLLAGARAPGWPVGSTAVVRPSAPAPRLCDQLRPSLAARAAVLRPWRPVAHHTNKTSCGCGMPRRLVGVGVCPARRHTHKHTHTRSDATAWQRGRTWWC